MRSQATTWLRRADLFAGIGKPEGGFGVLANNPQPIVGNIANFASEQTNADLIKEASR
jgi:hypothetical protein